MLHDVKLFLREHATALEMREAVSRPHTFDPQACTIEVVVATDQPVARRDAMVKRLTCSADKHRRIVERLGIMRRHDRHPSSGH